MGDPGIGQRRAWLTLFPEGSIEFIVVTRIMALLLIGAPRIVPPTWQAMALTTLAVVLWVDYLLTLWWIVQVATDLDDLFREPPPSSAAARRRRMFTAVAAAAPSVAVLLLVAPWWQLVLPAGWTPSPLLRVLHVGLLIVFLTALIAGQRALQRVCLGPRFWTLLLLVPVVHWLALHRLLTSLDERIRARVSSRGDGARLDGAGLRLAVALADLFWVLTVLPWAALLIVALVQAASGGGSFHPSWLASALPFCGMGAACLFAVADVAAMEYLQRRFVASLS